MHGFAQPEDRFQASNSSEDMGAGSDRSSALDATNRASRPNRGLEEPELVSALQLLVERAQYITGATGTALALPQGNEMVCRASAGTSAPAVGARLQVLSGLTGESITRRQLLRCDNAETDPRVNLEACRSLGIASIVVLPLFRHNGEVRGVIELFSDHPYAFEERDLVALERMADLTATALDLAEQRQDSGTIPPQKSIEAARATGGLAQSLATESQPNPTMRRGSAIPVEPNATVAKATVPRDVEPPSLASAASVDLSSTSSSSAASVPEALRRMQKCSACGFPVSEGRTLCLDCEKKKRSEAQKEIRQPAQDVETSSALGSSTQEEFVPPFLANAELVQPSWLSNHINLLALIVLILGIVVAVVVFR